MADEDFFTDIVSMGRRLQGKLNLDAPIPFTQRGGLLESGSYRSRIKEIWGENGLTGRPDIPERIIGDLSQQYQKTYDEFFRKGAFESRYEDLPPVIPED